MLARGGAGNECVLAIQVYLHKSACESIEPVSVETPSKPLSSSSNSKVKPARKRLFGQEMDEAEAEKILSLRKHAIHRMMDSLGLRPTQSNATLEAHKRSGAVDDHDAMLAHYNGSESTERRSGSNTRKDQNNSTKKPDKGKGKVIDIPSTSDAEPDELDQGPDIKTEEEQNQEAEGEEAEGEAMDRKEVDTIFRRAAANDLSLPEMEPPASFKLDLRPYQKQALHWMCAMESGESDARSSLSLHPLFEEYAFPQDPMDLDDVDQDQIVKESTELKEDERKRRFFYYSPYSGALSLDFPKASKRCKGGILADEMVRVSRTVPLMQTPPHSWMALIDSGIGQNHHDVGVDQCSATVCDRNKRNGRHGRRVTGRCISR